MAKRKGKKTGDKGYSNPQSSSWGIVKRARKEKNQQASRINLNSPSVPAIAPTFAFAPAYSNVPAFPSVTLRATRSWGVAQGENMVCGDQLSGYIFMCNGKTKADCFKYRVFGLPAARMEVVEKIKPQMKLFLFDFDLKLLYGIYLAASNGKLAIDPTAFGGKFSAQVRFEIFKDCLPLPESAFKHVIKDNYHGGFKFRQELSGKQVTSLISLFRPMAMSPQPAVLSLRSTAVPPAKIEPPGIEVWSRPAAELSASYDQYLAGLHVIQAGPKYHCQHGQPTATPFSHVPAAKVQSMHLQPVGAQPQSETYYPAGAYQVYYPENPAPQDPYSRYAAVPRDSEMLATTNDIAQAHAVVPSQFSTPLHGHAYLPSSSLTAAYWTAVATEGPKQVYPTPCQSIPSGSTGLGEPVTSAGATLTQPTVPENRDWEILLQPGSANEYYQNPAPAAAANAFLQAHAAMPLQFQAPLPGSVHFPSSSSTTGYWTAVAPSQVYSGPYQWQPLASTGLEAESVPISLTGAGSAAPCYTAVPGNGVKEFVPHAGTTNDYYNHNIIRAATTNSAVQAHEQVAYQPLAPSHGPTHLPSLTKAAAYWTAVASHDPNQVSSSCPHQILPSGNSGLGGEHLGASSLAGAATTNW